MSTDRQREQRAAAAQPHGFSVVGEFVDAGAAGANAARPALYERRPPSRADVTVAMH